MLKLVAMDPTDFRHITTSAQFAPQGKAEEIDHHVMKPGAAFRIGEDTIEDFDDFPDLHGETGFFCRFPCRPLAQGLAEFEHAAGNRPCALQRFAGTPDHYHAIILNDDGAYGHDGPV